MRACLIPLIAVVQGAVAVPALGQSNATTTYRYSIAGPRLSIVRSYNPGQPSMIVCARDACTTVSNDSPIALPVQHPYFIVLDAPGDTVTITVDSTAPKPVVSSLPAPRVLEPGMYEESDDAIDYRGSWILQQRDGPSEGRVRSTIETDSFVQFQFRGSALEIGVATYDDRHTLRLCVDGRCDPHNLFSQALHWQVPVAVTGLDHGVHTVRMSLQQGKAIDLDYVKVFPHEEPLPQGVHAPDRPGIQFSTGWTKEAGFMRADRRTSSAFFFDFIGTRARLRLRTGGDFGETIFCIDGHCRTHDLYSFRPGSREIVLDAPTGPARHHVTVRKGRTRFIGLDGVTVE